MVISTMDLEVFLDVQISFSIMISFFSKLNNSCVCIPPCDKFNRASSAVLMLYWYICISCKTQLAPCHQNFGG